MLKEGYAGARFVKQVTENLWGWQVTVPEAVDGAKWNEMYETYVADRNQLGVKEMFREAKNLLAYQAVVDRMLVAINKGYWKADPQVKAALEQVNREVIAEAGVACDETSCSSKEVTEVAKAEDRKALSEALAMPAPDLGRQSALAAKNSAHQAQSASVPPAASPASSPDPSANTPPPKAAAPQDSSRQVEGFEVREQLKRLADLPPAAKYSALSGFAALVFGGFVLRSRRRGRRSRLPLGVRSVS
jgi:cobaltochelatase CobN